MHYCELTPRNNRGIVHLKSIVPLKDCKLVYNEDSKFIEYIDIISRESFEIYPLYRYKLLEDSKNHSKCYYKFEVALRAKGDCLKKYNNKDLSDSVFGLEYSIKEPVESLDLGKHKCLLSGFNKSEIKYKILNLSTSDDIIWTEFILSCRYWQILEDNLLSVDINLVEGVHYIYFRIGIKTNPKADFINLKVDSISCVNDIDLLKQSNNLVIKCKNCETELDLISNFYPLYLPSDLYINSISSIYCEECQDNLVDHNSVCDKLEVYKNKNVLCLYDEIITINKSLSKNYKDNKLFSQNTNSNHLDKNNIEEKSICCSNCNIVIGSEIDNSISYLKNRVSAFTSGFDIFWHNSEYIEVIERIQSEESLKLSLSCNSETIHIIKVSREPDTFIFVQNNPVLTTRILFKIESLEANKLNNSTHMNLNCTLHPSGEQLDNKVYDHIKSLILIFSHNRDISDFVPSLLPQL